MIDANNEEDAQRASRSGPIAGAHTLSSEGLNRRALPVQCSPSDEPESS